MLPAYHLLPCVGAMASLVSRFQASVLLCTATQPVLGDLFNRFCPGKPIIELCSNMSDRFHDFQRVTYRNGSILSDEALVNELRLEEQALCIVNTRKAAQALYSLLPEDGRYHLSTLMYPAHRKQILKTIRERLRLGLPCRVISTSLIEAGVDIDFPKVWRELAGLDSIAQAAGRCNREGLQEKSHCIVTYFQSEHPIPPLQRIPVWAAQEALKNGADPSIPETVTHYFTALRSLIGENMDKSNVIKTARENLLPMETIAKNFHLIDQETFTVYIPLMDGETVCRPLLNGHATREDYRLAGQYAVNVYQQHFQSLLEVGDIQLLSENSAILLNLSLYNPEMGLSTKADAGKAEFI